MKPNKYLLYVEAPDVARPRVDFGQAPRIDSSIDHVVPANEGRCEALWPKSTHGRATSSPRHSLVACGYYRQLCTTAVVGGPRTQAFPSACPGRPASTVRLQGVARMLIASRLVCLACVLLVGNATAQLTPSEIPNFPPPAMQRQCPRTSSDVKFMAPNIPSNAPCKPFSADSPYCDPPPCYSGATDPLGFPQGGCHGKDENGRVSAARQPSRPPRCVTACRDSRS